MKNPLPVTALYLAFAVASSLVASASAATASWTFSFPGSPATPAPGVIALAATDTFSAERGYGFDLATAGSVRFVN